MKTVKLFSSILFLGVALMGCRSAEPFDQITRAANPEAFNYVTSAVGRAGSQVYSDAGYYIVFDDENKLASITISNIRVPGDDTPRTLTFTDVPMDYSLNRHQVERVIEADRLISKDPVNLGMEITDVTIVYIQSNSLDPNETDGIYARYTIDGLYTVTAYPYKIFAEGTTRVDDLQSKSTSYDYKTAYSIDLNPDNMTASLTISGLVLGAQISDVTISGLQFAITDNGYRLEMIPSTSVNSTDATCRDLTIDNLTVDAQLRGELRLDMRVVANGFDYQVAAFTSSNLTK